MFCKKRALKILQNLQKNTSIVVSLLRKRLQRRYFPASFTKFLRISFDRTPRVAASHYTKLTFNLIDVFMFSTGQLY